MQELGNAQAAPTEQELITLVGKDVMKIMTEETSESSDPDRVYLYREILRNWLYYSDLQNYAPSVYSGITDFTGTTGGQTTTLGDDQAGPYYDYSQNIYRGYARKIEAVLGNRMPNVVAEPDNASDPSSVKSVEAANNAALYIRQNCGLQMKNLDLVFRLFNYGTSFFHIDWVVDGEKYGYRQQEEVTEAQGALGNASFTCPGCAKPYPADEENPQAPGKCEDCGADVTENNYQPPQSVNVPQTKITQVPKGGLEINLHDGSEIVVPLESTCIEDCLWLDWTCEGHKGKLLKEYEPTDGSPNPLRAKDDGTTNDDETAASIYGQSVRAAMASPIGLVRPKKPNQWTVRNTWWTPAMYFLIDNKEVRQALNQNFPAGLRITSVRGKIVKLREEKLSDHWQECKPEPSARIMADPLGNDWIEVQDLVNNSINQRNETIDRSNEPGFADPTRIDFDAYQRRRDTPTELFPALPRAGGSLADIIYRPQPNQFSEQIAPFMEELVNRAESLTGMLPAIWGGADEEPTARQAELKKNAALMQLGVIWTQIGKGWERVYEKGCRLLAEYEDGVLNIAKKNEFQRYDDITVIIDDLRNGSYHFEADEAVPMTWGQERDLMMWMLDKPAAILEMWGFTDPMNIMKFKNLLGMPGERVPLVDNLKKCMSVIDKLIADKPTQAPPDPQGNPGPKQSSIQPDWEDDPKFNSGVIKAFLVQNPDLKTSNPDGYENIQLYGQACDKMANPPAPPPPPKSSVALSVKGSDLGDPAVQDALTKGGILNQGTPVEAQLPPLKPGEVPQNGEQVAPPSPPGAPPLIQ